MTGCTTISGDVARPGIISVSTVMWMFGRFIPAAGGGTGATTAEEEETATATGTLTEEETEEVEEEEDEACVSTCMARRELGATAVDGGPIAVEFELVLVAATATAARETVVADAGARGCAASVDDAPTAAVGGAKELELLSDFFFWC
jgi:hypothetical protein